MGMFFLLLLEAVTMHVEAISLLKAGELAKHFAMDRVIFSTDCLNLQHTVIFNAQVRSPRWILFSEARYLMGLGFIEHEAVFRPCSHNNRANVLTNFGAREIFGSHVVWLMDLPNDVTHALSDNMVESRI
jgi:hypothetical protein